MRVNCSDCDKPYELDLASKEKTVCPHCRKEQGQSPQAAPEAVSAELALLAVLKELVDSISAVAVQGFDKKAPDGSPELVVWERLNDAQREAREVLDS